MKTVTTYLAIVLLGGALGIFSTLVGDWLGQVSFDTKAPESEIIAVLPVYDDPRTKRLVGYLKLYDS